MKLLCLFSVCLLCSCGNHFETVAEKPGTAVVKTPAKGEPAASPISDSIAVVELFTSQGCSSCPPADKVLSQIADLSQQKQNRDPVYCLSFHVDYWNSLGWTDPYSDAKFTARQRAYAKAWNSRQVYTPQMIVNGQTQFVGSRGNEAKEALEAALKTKSVSSIKLEAKVSNKSREVAVAYVVTGETDDSLLNLALVQKTAQNEVPRGENAGRELGHVNVVRAYQTALLNNNGTGKLTLAIPDDLDLKQAAVIGYVQDRNTLLITGASEVGVSESRE